MYLDTEMSWFTQLIIHADVGSKFKIMRHILIIIIILTTHCLFGQSDSSLFNSVFRFKDGVYTQNKEVLINEPKYLKHEVEAKVDVLLGKLKFYYIGESSAKHPLTDSIFAYVEQGSLFVYYKNQFHKLILKGPISTFYIETTTKYSTGYVDKYDKLYFVDILTGEINRLTPDNIDKVLKRDDELYLIFSNSSDSKKKKTLYSYIIKYNQNNPLYIKTNN